MILNLTKINKRKTSMLLFQIEESLVNFILEQTPQEEIFPQKTVSNIVKRCTDKNISVDKTNIESLLEETYFDEIFSFALEVTKNTSTHQYIQELMSLFKLYNIFYIRNVVAHPSKPFLNEYWYKVAAIASSTLVEIIGLNDIKASLISAESGQITDPPDDWLIEITQSIIPNNLPNNFEHSITGLVGRSTEEKDLLKQLENLRNSTIAITASGGIGKTALVLDMLNNLVFDPKTYNWCHCIIYIDMKTEKLTKDGIEKLIATETIEEIKHNIIKITNNIFNEFFTDIESIFQTYSDKKVLLFIDNLETLIRDNQEEFDEFNMSLPRDWRLLVTSRISISSACVIPLKKLNKKSANQLAKIYTKKQGFELLGEEEYLKILESCHYNPLAIRLSLDLYLSGHALPSSINQSNNMIAEFSFKNLVENLSENSIMILEALFTESNLDRIALCELLKLTIDDIVEGINELSKTSLISRRTENDLEFFNLSSSIRELLISSPRNIEIRKNIQKQLMKAKEITKELERSQFQNGIDEFDTRFIPTDINKTLIVLLQEFNSAMSTKKFDFNLATEFYPKFKQYEELFNNEYMYHRTIGRLLEALGKVSDAIDAHKMAINLKPDDNLSKLLLAKIYFYLQKEYLLSENIYLKIMSSTKLGQNIKFAKTILNGYFLSLLYQHKYEVVLEKTINWKDSSHLILKGILGTYRASAWKRKIESLHHTQSIEYMEAIENAIEIYNDLFDLVGYIDIACRQALKLFDEIERTVGRPDYPNEKKRIWLDFIEAHIINISSNFGDKDENYFKDLVYKLSLEGIENNQFKDDKWNQYTNKKFSNLISEEHAIENGFIIVNIKNIPKVDDHKYSKYIFGTDGINDYFIHFDYLDSKCWNDWIELSINTKLAIKFETEDNRRKAIEVHIIEE